MKWFDFDFKKPRKRRLIVVWNARGFSIYETGTCCDFFDDIHYRERLSYRLLCGKKGPVDGFWAYLNVQDLSKPGRYVTINHEGELSKDQTPIDDQHDPFISINRQLKREKGWREFKDRFVGEFREFNKES